MKTVNAKYWFAMVLVLVLYSFLVMLGSLTENGLSNEFHMIVAFGVVTMSIITEDRR
jgi:hypothetical protein